MAAFQVITEEIRAEAQQRRRFLQSGGQFTLLDPEVTYVERRLSRLLQKNQDLAKDDLHKLLRRSATVPFDGMNGAWARAMQFSLVTETDLKEWIQEWVKAGDLEVLNMRSGQQVPKRNKNHILRWISKKR